MHRDGLAAVALAVLVLLAGCGGALGPTSDASVDGSGTDADDPGDGAGGDSNDDSEAGDGGGTGDTDGGSEAGTSSGSSSSDVDTGQVSFYVSDERNAIDQFESLEVTITRVGLARAGGEGTTDETDTQSSESANESDAEANESDDDDTNESDDDTNETDVDDANETAGLTASFVGAVVRNETATVEVTNDSTPVENADVAVNGTLVGETDAEGRLTFAVSDEPTFTVLVADGEAEVELVHSFEEETEADGTDDSSGGADENDSSDTDAVERGGWVEYDIDGRAVDLTELQGAKATRLADFDVAAGKYTKVFVYVSEVRGTLTTGEQVNVKLPSDKLQLNRPFTVGSGESVNFVFDITVVEAGRSGKFVLKPVIGESGTDVPIEPVSEESETGAVGNESAGLTASFVGAVVRKGTATIEVTNDSTPVENAAVAVNGTLVGETDAEGRLTFDVSDGPTFTVLVTAGEAEVELVHSFEETEAQSAEADGGPGNSGAKNNGPSGDKKGKKAE